MFIKKTQAEINAMSDTEADNYSAAKEAHESTAQKLAVTEAVKTALEATEKTNNEKEVATAKQISDLKEIVEKQGVEIEKNKKDQGSFKGETIETVFKAAYDAVDKNNDHGITESITIDTKALASTDVMTVGPANATDFPSAGTTGAVSAPVQSLFGKLIGYFGYRSPASKILDLVDVQPLDSATLIVINETTTGDAAITTEGKLHPIVKMSFDTQEKSADAVSVEFYTNSKLRRFFPALINRMMSRFTDLINVKLPNEVLLYIKNNATAFTPVAQLAINNNPNNYDAIGAVIATIENLGLTPTCIVLNPIAWRNIKQAKSTTGEYILQNGDAVSILDNGIDWGGTKIMVVKDPKIGVDEFIIGDLFATVKVGVDTQLTYYETDGRTDAQAGTSLTGASRSIRTHGLEKFFAVIIPTGSKVGLIKDTFSNVKTLITAA